MTTKKKFKHLNLIFKIDEIMITKKQGKTLIS